MSHSQTPFNASRIGCLVDQRGKSIESVIINNFSHSMKTLYDLLSPLFRKIEECVVICCNRIRDVVREQKNSYRDRGIFSASFSGKRCIARQLCNSQHKVAPPAGREQKKGQQSDLTLG